MPLDQQDQIDDWLAQCYEKGETLRSAWWDGALKRAAKEAAKDKDLPEDKIIRNLLNKLGGWQMLPTFAMTTTHPPKSNTTKRRVIAAHVCQAKKKFTQIFLRYNEKHNMHDPDSFAAGVAWLMINMM